MSSSVCGELYNSLLRKNLDVHLSIMILASKNVAHATVSSHCLIGWFTSNGCRPILLTYKESSHTLFLQQLSSRAVKTFARRSHLQFAPSCVHRLIIRQDIDRSGKRSWWPHLMRGEELSSLLGLYN